MAGPAAHQIDDEHRPANLPRAELRAARERGLAWLDALIGADGRWPSSMVSASGRVTEEFPPFPAALGCLALASSEQARARALCARTRDHIERICEYPGLWRYWDHLPPDLDDTSICSLVSTSHAWILFGLNIDALLRYRDRTGRFRTWMVSRADVESTWNGTDAVVNANVIAYLGDRPQTRRAQRWIGKIVRQGKEAEALVYYSEPMDLYLAAARAAHVAPPAFHDLRSVLSKRILALFDPRPGRAEVQRLAQGIVALDMLGTAPERATLADAAARILETQPPQGGWPASDAWRRGPEFPVTFRSEALATAWCIAAIEVLLLEGPCK